MFKKDIIKNATGINSILIDVIILINIILLSILQKIKHLLVLSLIANPNCSRERVFAGSLS